MRKFLKILLLYAAVFFLLIFIFLQSLFHLYKFLPNDYSRLQVIFNTMKDPAKKPEIIVLGDSRAVFGIDAKTITANLPGRPLAYNMASVGQAIQEAALFLSIIPDSVKHILHCIPYTAVTNNDIYLLDERAICMIMYGYHLDSASSKIAGNVNPYFYRNRYEVAFQSRSVIKGTFHLGIRNMLDDEKFGDNFHDLYFPNILTTDRHLKYPFNSPQINNDSLHVAENLKQLVIRMDKYCKSRNIVYHLVLMPLNPDVPTPDSSAHDIYMAEIKRELPAVRVIDMSRVLNNVDFYDGVHANKKGAEKLSVTISGYVYTKQDSLQNK